MLTGHLLRSCARAHCCRSSLKVYYWSSSKSSNKRLFWKLVLKVTFKVKSVVQTSEMASRLCSLAFSCLDSQNGHFYIRSLKFRIPTSIFKIIIWTNLKVVGVASAPILQRKVGLGVSRGKWKLPKYSILDTLGRKESERSKNFKKSIVKLFTKRLKTPCCSLKIIQTS